MSKRAWIIFAVIVVVVLGGLIYYSRASNPAVDVSNIDVTKVQAASDQNGQIGDHVYGASDAKVTIIEYGDFECPYCGQAYPQIKSVAAAYKDQVAFIFRNFPLTTIHPNARAAAAAAEAAGLQGEDKYWAMHDALYDNQSSWENLTGDARTNAFAGYAQSIGVDMDKYNAALANGATTINKKIAFDQALATKLNITSTPSIFVNGTAIGSDVNQDLESGTGTKLEDLLNTDLKAAGVALPTGQ